MIAAVSLLAASLSMSEFGTATNLLTRGAELSVVSRRCDMDRKGGVVFFDGDARVDYRPGYSLFADSVFAIFRGTNVLERLEAVGGVTITNDQRIGTCDRAVFWRERGEIEMLGWPDGRPARLSDGSKNAIAGRRMRFWLKESQVEIEDSELTVNKDGRSVGDL